MLSAILLALPLAAQASPSVAWGLSGGGGGGAGFTFRQTALDGTGWSFSGSLLRLPTYNDMGWPYVLVGIKRYWILRQTDRARLYQSTGTSFLFNGYPSFYAPQPTAPGGGTNGIHTVGAGYGIQLGPERGWKIGFEVDFGLAVLWPGLTQAGGTGISAFFLPMPELSLMYEY